MSSFLYIYIKTIYLKTMQYGKNVFNNKDILKKVDCYS